MFTDFSCSVLLDLWGTCFVSVSVTGATCFWWVINQDSWPQGWVCIPAFSNSDQNKWIRRPKQDRCIAMQMLGENTSTSIFFFFCWDWYGRTDVEAVVGRDFYRMTWQHQRPEAAESRSRHEFSTGTAKDTNCWFRWTTSDPWGLDPVNSSWSPAASDFPCLASVSLNGISVICGPKKFCHCSVTQSCPTLATPWTTTCQASLSFTISQSLLKLMPTESVMPSNHLILCCPLLLLPSIFPSIRVFSDDSAI